MTNKSFYLVGVAVVVSLLLSVLAFGFAVSKKGFDPASFAGFQRGEQVFEDGASLGDNRLLTIQKEVVVGNDLATLFNNQGYGKRFVVEDAYVSWDNDRASTSIRAYIFATSSPNSVPNSQDYTAMTHNATSTLMKFKIATSSPNAFASAIGYNATTTSARQLARTATFDGSTAFGREQLVLQQDEKLMFYVQQGDLLGSCTSGTYVGKCESATSTSRGINFDIVIKGFFRN